MEKNYKSNAENVCNECKKNRKTLILLECCNKIYLCKNDIRKKLDKISSEGEYRIKCNNCEAKIAFELFSNILDEEIVKQLKINKKKYSDLTENKEIENKKIKQNNQKFEENKVSSDFEENKEIETTKFITNNQKLEENNKVSSDFEENKRFDSKIEKKNEILNEKKDLINFKYEKTNNNNVFKGNIEKFDINSIINNKKIVFDGEEKCIICNEIRKINIILKKNCDHIICEICFLRNFKNLITKPSLKNSICPVENCLKSHKLAKTMVNQILNNEASKKYEDSIKCICLFSIDKEKDFQCSSCNKFYCSDCLKHNDYKCGCGFNFPKKTNKDSFEMRNLNKNYNENNVIQKKPSSEEPKIKCGMCLEYVKITDCITNIECDHRFCKNCMIDFFLNSIKEKILIVCPHNDCKKEIDIEIVKDLLPRERFSEYDKFITNKALYNTNNVLKNDEKIVYCKYCDICIIIENDATNYKCYNCNRQFCANNHCNLLWHLHNGKTCNQLKGEDINEENFKHLKKNSGWRNCPKCNIVVEKIKFCNFIRCESKECLKKTIFCYLCGERLDEETKEKHFIDNNTYMDCHKYEKIKHFNFFNDLMWNEIKNRDCKFCKNKNTLRIHESEEPNIFVNCINCNNKRTGLLCCLCFESFLGENNVKNHHQEEKKKISFMKENPCYSCNNYDPFSYHIYSRNQMTYALSYCDNSNCKDKYFCFVCQKEYYKKNSDLDKCYQKEDSIKMTNIKKNKSFLNNNNNNF